MQISVLYRSGGYIPWLIKSRSKRRSKKSLQSPTSRKRKHRGKRRQPKPAKVKQRTCKKFCVWMIFFAEKNHPYTKFFTGSLDLTVLLQCGWRAFFKSRGPTFKGLSPHIDYVKNGSEPDQPHHKEQTREVGTCAKAQRHVCRRFR
jgi:hypothetical protein